MTALLVAALVAVAFLLPSQFMGALWGDGAPAVHHISLPLSTPAVAASPAADPPALGSPAARPTAPASPPAASPEPAAKAAGEVVANTFQTLYAGPNGPSLDQPAPDPAAAAAAPAASTAGAAAPPAQPVAPGKGVVTRVVDTLVIHADPKTGAIQTGAIQAAASQPVAGAPAAAAPVVPQPPPATAEPVPLAPLPDRAATAAAPTMVADIPASIAPPKPAADPEPATTPAPAAADAHDPVAIVGGKGVTARAGPATARSALFTIAAGQKLSVLGKERGWLHITDAKGRAGWVYSSLVRMSDN